MINEIHPAVEANNVNKRRKLTVVNSRRKACKSIIIRAVVALALIVALYVAPAVGLMSWALSSLLITATGVWIAVWVGAWMQFMWGKEGLLK